jgi:hypothetical protein
LGCVEGCFRFLVVALLDAHGEGCVCWRSSEWWEGCTTNARGVSVSVDGKRVVEVYVHKLRGVYRWAVSRGIINTARLCRYDYASAVSVACRLRLCS